MGHQLTVKTQITQHLIRFCTVCAKQSKLFHTLFAQYWSVNCILSNGEVIKYHKFISVVVIELSARCLNTGPEDRLGPRQNRCLKRLFVQIVLWSMSSCE